VGGAEGETEGGGTMSVPGWFILGLPDDVIFDWAEHRRVQRSERERLDLYQRLARQRVRFILRRLGR